MSNAFNKKKEVSQLGDCIHVQMQNGDHNRVWGVIAAWAELPLRRDGALRRKREHLGLYRLESEGKQEKSG